MIARAGPAWGGGLGTGEHGDPRHLEIIRRQQAR